MNGKIRLGTTRRGLMPKMTPEAEVRYALNFNIARSDLSIYTSELNP